MKRAGAHRRRSAAQEPASARQRAACAPPARVRARPPALHPDRRGAHRAAAQDHARGRASPATASSTARPAPTSSRSATSTPKAVAGRWTAVRPWRTPHPFQRVPSRYFDRPGFEDSVVTPDKANAALRAGLNVRMRDDHPDFPALVLANHLLGGSSTARMPARVREKEGLSYSTYTTFTPSALDEAGVVPRRLDLRAAEPRARRARDPRGAGARGARGLQRRGESRPGKRSVLEARRLARSQDRALASRLGHYLFVKRTFAWDIDFEKQDRRAHARRRSTRRCAAHRPGAARRSLRAT